MKKVEPLMLFQHLLHQKKSVKKAALLGVDVGDKFVGLAMSDSSNKIAIPVGVLHRTKTNFDLVASDFQKLVSNFSLAGFVIGCPYGRSQSTSDAHMIRDFLHNLRQTGKFNDLKFTFWNECFTSKCVQLQIEPLNFHPVAEKTILDKFAANQILQEYLDSVNRKMKSNTRK